MNTVLTRPTLALLIDCWHNQSDPILDQTWHNIANYCCSNPYIQTVSVSSYTLNGFNYDLVKEEPWWSQSDELFNQTTKWDYLRQDWHRFRFHTDQDAGVYTSPIIRDMKIRSDQVPLMIANTVQLAYYCNYINPAIENIMIMGMAWDMCLQTRPVGWDEVSYACQYGLLGNVKNILTKQDCVLSSNCQRPEISSPWIPIDNQHFYLDYSQHNINI